MKNKLSQIITYIFVATLIVGGVVFAGSLNSSVNTGTTNFLTLSDLYNKIVNNTYSTSTHSLSTTSVPASTMHTLAEIYNAIPTIDAGTIINGITVMGVTGTYNASNLIPNNVLSGTSYGTSSVGTLSAGSSWNCGDLLHDALSSQTYSTVLLGSQCWMSQDLNAGTRIPSCANGFVGTCTSGGSVAQNQGTSCSSVQKYCYNDTDSNCDTYGGFYQWNQAMCGSTSSGGQGICPAGWHIPTDAEWYTLENSQKDAGQTCSPTRVNTWDCLTAGSKFQSTGFMILPGYRLVNGSFTGITSGTYLWSSDATSTTLAMRRLVATSNTGVFRGTADKNIGYSVRCIKN